MCYSPSTKNKCKEDTLQKMGQKDISEKVLADYKTCGRSADVAIAAEDEEARKRFYKEFGIID